MHLQDQEKENLIVSAMERGLITYGNGWYSLCNRYKLHGKAMLLNAFNDPFIFQKVKQYLEVDQVVIRDLESRIRYLENEIQSFHEEAAGSDI